MAPVFVLTVFVAVFYSVQGRSIVNASFEMSEEDIKVDSTNSIEDDLSASTLIMKANRYLGQKPDEPLVMFGDIIVDPQVRNADPCTANDCKWPKSSDGKVYVPYVISNQYSTQKKSTIECGLRSFHTKTCIRFVPRTNQQDFLNITSLSGCYSSVGRRGNGQVLSLNRDGCVYFSVVQHEILHALGFHHEHTRRDRDGHVKILEKNIEPGKEHNFEKHNTINLQTPYDYNSIMHYKRCAFSVNGQPTILPIPDNNVAIGFATQMSPNDILRINRLYKCHSMTAGVI